MAERLEQLGFPETYALQGGYDAWVEAGLPTVSKYEGAGLHA